MSTRRETSAGDDAVAPGPGQDDPLRMRWFVVRLALMAVDAVGLVLAAVLMRSHPTLGHAVAATAGAAICGAALWDLAFLRRRWYRVLGRVQHAPLLDPLDSWINVTCLSLPLVAVAFVGDAPLPLRVAVGSLGLAGALISWGGHRRYGWQRVQAVLRARAEAAAEEEARQAQRRASEDAKQRRRRGSR